MLQSVTGEQKLPLLIIGFGMAAARLLNKLAELGYKSPIVVVSREKHLGYNRIQLTPWLSGERTDDELALVNEDVWSTLSIKTLPLTDVTRLDTHSNTAYLSNNETLHYSKAVIATGASPRMPALDYYPQPAIRAFRTLDDGHYLRNLPEDSHIAVLGGGLLGLEAAWGLRQLGYQVSLIQVAGHVLNRQLNKPLAQLLEQTFTDAGIHLELNTQIEAIESVPVLSAIKLSNGKTLNANCLISAIGIKPSCKVALSSGIDCNFGILINNRMQTSAKDVFALGECAELDGHIFGLVAPAYEQAEVLARNLCGANQTFAISNLDTRLKISGMDVFSTGDISNAKARVLTLVDEKNLRARAVHLLGNQVIGAELIGDLSLTTFYNELIRTQQPVSDATHALTGRANNAA
ncbi:NAD(P)/FAD-dependent oxidoreductase [Reinekea marinisedimentorum]|uniref:Nitrite reductase (NADH) large subunit n=1 Tax=Reinekea marinisedimentorum TaxID=230495 RepID=A0A4R3I4F4_9GAMM|nr:FAD-dependent oxidoreductase [Reinekea marinisedimentorum]TCS39771.1 nitrite reductase (NADH) large subunit [Reinekea marinisedimentorum]